MPTELRIVKVEAIDRESPAVYTIRYRDSTSSLPGQFVMVWVPGVNEIPMSLSYIGEMKGFTFRPLGAATKALSSMKAGEKIGVRGAYGNSFIINDGEVLCVGGGTGIASIITAIEALGRRAEVVIGARNAEELFFEKRIEEAGARLHICTDDGSRGHMGFVTDIVSKLLEKGRFREMIACGPEGMLYRLAMMAHSMGIHAQLSVERHMKCGIGICDACALDGRLVCRDGPIFDAETLLSTSDFGKFRLSPDGRKSRI